MANKTKMIMDILATKTNALAELVYSDHTWGDGGVAVWMKDGRLMAQDAGAGFGPGVVDITDHDEYGEVLWASALYVMDFSDGRGSEEYHIF